MLHALSDPLRLCLVKRLARHSGGPCCELQPSVAKSTLSHHLRVLREAGVIRVQVDGTVHRTCLRRDDLHERFPGLLDSIIQAAEAEPAEVES